MGNVNPRPYGRQASSTSVQDLSTRPQEDLEDDIAVSTNNTVNNNAQYFFIKYLCTNLADHQIQPERLDCTLVVLFLWATTRELVIRKRL
jgi:recombinational DNA repair protein RecR